MSAVVPMHDEADNAGRFLASLATTLRGLTDRFEIVAVNDGSLDRTREVTLGAARACGVHYVELSRNFGKEAAVSAGLQAARGDVVLVIDADFQHPVEAIPTMLARWRDGYDVVFGVRSSRDGEPWVKRRGAAAFYRVVAGPGGDRIVPDSSDFRLMDRKVVDALLRLPERSRFMKGLFAWVGFRSTPLPYDAPPRAGGHSSFGYRRLTALAVTGITAFTYLPLRAISLFGILVSVGALVYGAWVIVETLVYHAAPSGYPTIVVSIMFFAGVQLLSMGVIGEYLARVFEEVKRRPLFIVSDQVDFSPLEPREGSGT
jgi:glycosyltransferase involved in cell wall biosynthesis